MLGTRDIREDPPDPDRAPFGPWLVQLTADGCYTPGCTNDTILLTDAPNSVTYAPEAVGLTLYPNPAVSRAQLTLPAAYRNQPLRYQLLTPDGRPVAERRFTGPATVVDVGGLPGGIYLLRVFGPGGAWVAARRVVKSD